VADLGINPTNSLSLISGSGKTEKAAAPGDFVSLFDDMLQQVEEAQHRADDLTLRFMAGDVDEIHQVAFAMEQAKLSLQLAVQVRNKIVDAYQEVMRMQV